MLPFRARIDFKQIKKVLFIRKDNLGDLLYTLPLVSLLKQYYPHLIIDFMLPNYTAPLAKLCPDIDHVFILPTDIETSAMSYQATLSLIKDQEYGMAFNIHPKRVLAKLIYDAKVPLRLGRTERIYAIYYNHWIFQNRKHQLKHELEYNLDLIKEFVPLPAREDIQFNLEISDAAEKKVTDFLQQHDISLFTIIHPGSNSSAIDLPLYNYAQLIDEYNFPGQIVITGTSKETLLYQTLEEICQKPLINAIEQFSIEELLCLIKHAELVISNSTGPLHLARALNKNLLGFYTTMKSGHPRRWGPYLQEQSHTFIPEEENFYTFEKDAKRCRKNMAEINIELVKQKLDLILNREINASPHQETLESL